MPGDQPRPRIGPGWAGRVAPGPAWPHPGIRWGLRGCVPGLRYGVCCRSEKEALESSLFEVQRQLAQLESRREQLEADGRALLLAKEALTGRQAWGKGRGTPGSTQTVPRGVLGSP